MEPNSSLVRGVHHEVPVRGVHHTVPVQSYSAEQTKEAFNVARNSIELLSTVISSSPQQDALQVFLLYQLTNPYFDILIEANVIYLVLGSSDLMSN